MKEWSIRESEKQQQQQNIQENAPKKIRVLDIDICHGNATLKIQSYYDN